MLREHQRSFLLLCPVMRWSALLEDTISYVERAKYPHRCIFVVIDGGGHPELAESVSSRFATWARAQDELVLLTASNLGMYGAIREGLEFALRGPTTLTKAERERVAFSSLTRPIGVNNWMGWLGAGDYIDPSAFTILDAVGEQSDFSWVCGLHAYATYSGNIFDARLPFRFKRRDLEAGIYGTLLPGLQQESTFWKIELMMNLDWDAFISHKVAGDAFLWRQFGHASEPMVIQALLGAHRSHPNHLHSTGYQEELPRRGIFDMRPRHVWHLFMRKQPSARLKSIASDRTYLAVQDEFAYRNRKGHYIRVN